MTITYLNLKSIKTLEKIFDKSSLKMKKLYQNKVENFIKEMVNNALNDIEGFINNEVIIWENFDNIYLMKLNTLNPKDADEFTNEFVYELFKDLNSTFNLINGFNVKTIYPLVIENDV